MTIPDDSLILSRKYIAKDAFVCFFYSEESNNYQIAIKQRDKAVFYSERNPNKAIDKYKYYVELFYALYNDKRGLLKSEFADLERSGDIRLTKLKPDTVSVEKVSNG